MADVYAKIKRGKSSIMSGNIVVTDDNDGLYADINDNTTIKFQEDGTAYIDISDGNEPSPLTNTNRDPITERKVYNALPSINGSKEYDANMNIIVPTSEGIEGQIPTMRRGKLVFENPQETHSHDNKNVLDGITNSGNGDKFLSDNGIYKEINIPDQLVADGITVKIENDKLIAISLEGLEATITTLNFVKNLDKDIMSYIRSIGNPMKFKGVVGSDTDLSSITTHESGDTYIVRNSVSNDNKKMSFVSNGTTFEPIAETEITVRDFMLNPINLEHEVSGKLPASNIDDAIARKTDIPSMKQIEESMHSHDNKNVLDNITNSGSGDKFLSDNGTYKEIQKITIDTNMNENSENPVQNKVIMAYIKDNAVQVDDTMDDNSENPVQNKIVKEYIDTVDQKVDDNTKIKPTIDADNVNALSRSADGLFVKDLTPTVNRLNYAQKTCRDNRREWIYLFDSNDGSNSASNDINIELQPLNLIEKCQGIQTTLDDSRYKSDRITLKAGISYKIDITFIYNTISHNKVCLIGLVDMNNQANNLQPWKWVGEKYYTVITPTEDIDIGLLCKNNENSCVIHTGSLSILVEAIEPTVIDPVEYVDNRDGLQDNPVGTVIAYLGLTAPSHYLLCDGSEYQITDYPYLAQHIKDNFGAENYWGGDGIETFATPDLRAEFLRGAGEATRQTGAGANVGQHQDPTTFITEGYGGLRFTTGGTVTPSTTVSSTTKTVSDNNATVVNDTTPVTNVTSYSTDSTGDTQTADQDTQLSVRPTATSVNYCIKAEPTYYLVVN